MQKLSLTNLTAIEILEQLNSTDETQNIEAKLCQNYLGSSILESISAFCNTPDLGGGYILLGVSNTGNLFGGYSALGINNPDKIQNDLIGVCRTSFNIPIYPAISCETIDDKSVILVKIDEVDELKKPVYIKSKHLPEGAFLRVGSGDVKCNSDDLRIFYNSHNTASYDESIIHDSTLDDLDQNAIKEYREELKAAKRDPDLLEASDTFLLRSISAIKKDQNGTYRLTVAGLMLFGSGEALRRLFPMTRIDYTKIDGKEWVQDPENRFENQYRLRGIMHSIKWALSVIMADIPKAFYLPKGQAQREEIPLLPEKAVREAIVNALMHRDYRVHGPTQIIRYSNRLEIRNPGYSLVNEDFLGGPNSQSRNPKIAAILHETRYAETKGSGIPTMRKKMEESKLLPPAFESDRNENQFSAIFLFHQYWNNSEDEKWLAHFSHLELNEEDHLALKFVREMGVITNNDYRTLNKVDTLTASQRLVYLRNCSLLEKRGKTAKTYYLPTNYLLNPADFPSENPVISEELVSMSEELVSMSEELISKSEELIKILNLKSSNSISSPEIIQITKKILKLGPKSNPQEVTDTIINLCRITPFSAAELAEILNKNPAHLRNYYLKTLIETGKLYLLYPGKNHPHQKYTTQLPQDAE